MFETFEANEDNTVFTATLRKGKWSDGQPVSRGISPSCGRTGTGTSWPRPALRRGCGPTSRPASRWLGSWTTTVIWSFTQPYGGFPVNLAIGGWRVRPADAASSLPRAVPQKYADPAKLEQLIADGKFGPGLSGFFNKYDNAWNYMQARTIDCPADLDLKEANDQRTVLERNPYYFKVDGRPATAVRRPLSSKRSPIEVLAVKQFAGGPTAGRKLSPCPRSPSTRRTKRRATTT